MTITNNTAFKINNLPFEYSGDISIPLEILSLQLDSSGYFITLDEEVHLIQENENLPNHITLSLFDSHTGVEYDIQNSSRINLLAEGKGSFSPTSNLALEPYPIIGEQRYQLLVHYGNLEKGKNNLLPSSFKLHQNYPNPFNPITTIRYDIPKLSEVKIVVHDIMGRQVATLVNTMKPAGYHNITWNGSNQLGDEVSSGMYIYSIYTKEFNFSKKMILLE